MSTNSLEPRVYEVGYHILPIVGEADLDAEVNLIRTFVTEKEGELIKEGAPRLIDLAYPMTKVIENKRNEFDKGYFGWIKFAIQPAVIADMKRMLDEHPNMLRYIILSTVREDTVVGDIPGLTEKTDEDKEGKKSKTNTKTKAKAEVDEKKLDQQIDDLVSEE